MYEKYENTFVVQVRKFSLDFSDILHVQVRKFNLDFNDILSKYR